MSPNLISSCNVLEPFDFSCRFVFAIHFKWVGFSTGTFLSLWVYWGWHFLSFCGLPQPHSKLLNHVEDWLILHTCAVSGKQCCGRCIKQAEMCFAPAWLILTVHHNGAKQRCSIVLVKKMMTSLKCNCQCERNQYLPSSSHTQALTIKLSRAHSYYDDGHWQGGCLWKKHRMNMRRTMVVPLVETQFYCTNMRYVQYMHSFRFYHTS